MSDTNDRKTGIIRRILPMLFFILIGIACGLLIVEYFGTIQLEGRSVIGMFLLLALYLIGMYGAILLQIIIHEAGHLLFGRLTGYGFSSFRVGSFMWVKDGKAIRFRRFSLMGTGGQCLLIPPEMKDGKCPYVLCNLGGSITNLASALLFFGLAQIAGNTGMLSALLMMLAAVGAVFALMNGIPMRFGTMDNDGYNALSLGKDKEALRSFWIQMKVSEQIASGARLKGMPDEWFAVPSENSMKNSMTAVMGVFACNRLMDQMRLEEAQQTMDKLLQMDTGIVGLHRNLMAVDQIYCELVGENRWDRLNSMLDKRQKKFMKAMKNFPSVLRTEYTYARLAEKDDAKAADIQASFEIVAGKYPYPGDIDAERELMAYADGLSKVPEDHTVRMAQRLYR